MTLESKQISVLTDRAASEVYEYAAEPANIAEWAPGLGSAMFVEHGQWYVETAEGRVGIRFVDRNDLGVLDHSVTTPSGDVVYSRCGYSPTRMAARSYSPYVGTQV